MLSLRCLHNFIDTSAVASVDASVAWPLRHGRGALHDLAGDRDIARRILARIDAGTTDEGTAWREPVGNYLDPTRFAG